MTGTEINLKIIKNEQEMAKILLSGNFMLSQDVVRLTKENEELRAKCPHEYNPDGICKYCFNEIGE